MAEGRDVHLGTERRFETRLAGDLDDEARRWLAEYTAQRVGLDGLPVLDVPELYPDLDEDN